MATVHFGRLAGPAGFSRVVAIKRLHANYAKDPDFAAMIFDEARLAARIRHPNVVAMIDMVVSGSEIFLVMEYVHGESLGKLWQATRAAGKSVDPRVVATMMSGVLHGLHAAHEARGERGEALELVHRDVSPQNILVGADGLARVHDFGVAKAAGRVQTTREGRIKGKLGYMPPEQVEGASVTRRTDVYAAAVVTWELLTGKRAFGGDHDPTVIRSILAGGLGPPSKLAPHVPAAFDRVVMRGLHRNPSRRYATAREMAIALERCIGIAPMSEVTDWVQSYAHKTLLRRALRISSIEASANIGAVDSTPTARPTDETTKRQGKGACLPAFAEPSGISGVTHLSFLARMRRGSRPFALVGSVLAALLATVLVVHWVAGRAKTRASAAAALAPPLPLSEQASTYIVRIPAAPASASALLPPSPPEPPVVAPPVAIRAARGRPSSAHQAAKAKGDCDSPFTIDVYGRKHYKSDCL